MNRELLLPRCSDFPGCPGAGKWGATGKLPVGHTHQPAPGGAYLAHMDHLSLDELVRLYGIRCAQVATAHTDEGGVPPFEAARSVADEISRRWDELAKQLGEMISVVNDLSVAVTSSQKTIREVLDRGRA